MHCLQFTVTLHLYINRDMAKYASWSDDYWLLLMQLYLEKPAGVKPIYARGLVQLALELHIEPRILQAKMFRLRQIDTPVLQQLWNKYEGHPSLLRKEANLLRRMNGFGQAGTFYQGVETNTMSWENDFKPIANTGITPLQLILILDLYFRLVPITMVPETPEIIELARMTDISAKEICHIMEIYQSFDPCLKRTAMTEEPLCQPCHTIWQRFGYDDPNKLAAQAAQIKEYFK